MGILSLLFSIISTILTSFTLSLLLPSRHLFSRLTTADAIDSVALYEGTIWHQRRRPVHHSFKYPVRYAFIDLDLVPHPPPDHLSPQQARDIAQTNGPIFLLTIPPSVGYQQNPLSVYYCYDLEGSTKCLKKCIAEATNTPWGERLHFLFNPNSDVVAKLLHVSPFMDMLGNWIIKTNVPGDSLVVNISVDHPKLDSETVVEEVGFFQHPMYENPSYKKDATTCDINLGCCPLSATKTNNQPQIKQSNQKGRWIRWRDAKCNW